jgi:hypothetical protein
MTALGLFLMYLGYAVLYWGWNGIQGKSQDSFASYLIPSAPNPKTSGGGGQATASSPTSNSPSQTKTNEKPIAGRNTSGATG